MPLKPQYTISDADILQHEELYCDFFRAEKITLRHRQFQTGEWGTPFTREMLYRGDAVGVVLYDPTHDLIALVEQFRVGALNEDSGPWCLEIVAGMVKRGETPIDVAHRELAEEAGVKNAKLEYITHYLASPGGTDEKIYLYCGLCNLENIGGIHGLADENEDIKVHVLPALEVFSKLYNGRLNNSAALISLQWLQLNKERLQEQSDMSGKDST